MLCFCRQDDEWRSVDPGRRRGSPLRALSQLPGAEQRERGIRQPAVPGGLQPHGRQLAPLPVQRVRGPGHARKRLRQ